MTFILYICRSLGSLPSTSAEGSEDIVGNENVAGTVVIETSQAAAAVATPPLTQYPFSTPRYQFKFHIEVLFCFI